MFSTSSMAGAVVALHAAARFKADSLVWLKSPRCGRILFGGGKMICR